MMHIHGGGARRLCITYAGQQGVAEQGAKSGLLRKRERKECIIFNKYSNSWNTSESTVSILAPPFWYLYVTYWRSDFGGPRLCIPVETEVDLSAEKGAGFERWDKLGTPGTMKRREKRLSHDVAAGMKLIHVNLCGRYHRCCRPDTPRTAAPLKRSDHFSSRHYLARLSARLTINYTPSRITFKVEYSCLSERFHNAFTADYLVLTPAISERSG